jgi:hypothetical protein
LLRQLPAFLWLPIYVGSEFILIGSSGDAGLLIAGGALALLAFALSLYFATRADDRPRPPLLLWAIAGVGLFYVLTAIAAATAGVSYAAAALAAGIIPMAAVSIVVAMVRDKTVADEGGRLRDRSAEDSEDPAPGIGVDDETPLGDTPEHSKAWEEDLVPPEADPEETILDRLRHLRLHQQR